MIQQSQCRQADAWQVYSNIQRKVKPRKYITLTEEEQESFVIHWEELYKEEELEDPPIANMANPPSEKEILDSMHALKNKKAAGPDEITAELLNGAGEIAQRMTITLIRRVWSEGTVP